MRSSFTIYLAAGLTLAFALGYAYGYGYQAYAMRHAIVSLSPVGDDLVRLRECLQDSYASAGICLALAALQAAIIVCARKLKRQAHAA